MSITSSGKTFPLCLLIRFLLVGHKQSTLRILPMVNKYLVGSSLLGLSNSKDLDYIILVENLPPKEKRPQQEGCEKVLDIGYRTFNETKKRLDFVQLDWLTICNYQLDQDIIGQDFPIEYHILEHRRALISYLKKIKNEHLCNFHKLIRINKKYCSRLIYHVAYNIFIL